VCVYHGIPTGLEVVRLLELQDDPNGSPAVPNLPKIRTQMTRIKLIADFPA
jgi:hypothetical protein